MLKNLRLAIVGRRWLGLFDFWIAEVNPRSCGIFRHVFEDLQHMLNVVDSFGFEANRDLQVTH